MCPSDGPSICNAFAFWPSRSDICHVYGLVVEFKLELWIITSFWIAFWHFDTDLVILTHLCRETYYFDSQSIKQSDDWEMHSNKDTNKWADTLTISVAINYRLYSLSHQMSTHLTSGEWLDIGVKYMFHI